MGIVLSADLSVLRRDMLFHTFMPEHCENSQVTTNCVCSSLCRSCIATMVFMKYSALFSSFVCGSCKWAAE